MKETGRKYITPCCTASTVEFVDDSGKKFLRCQVAGHGWTSDFWAGVVEDINDTGTIVEADGTERSIRYREPKPVCKGCGSELLYSDDSAYCSDCETERIVSSFAPVGCDPEKSQKVIAEELHAQALADERARIRATLPEGVTIVPMGDPAAMHRAIGEAVEPGVVPDFLRRLERKRCTRPEEPAL